MHTVWGSAYPDGLDSILTGRLQRASWYVRTLENEDIAYFLWVGKEVNVYPDNVVFFR